MTPFALLAVLLQDPYVRTHDQEVRVWRQPGARAEVEPGGRAFAFPPVCNALAAGRHGESVPGGGTLNPVAFVNPATIVGPAMGQARSAFVSQVSGAARNQGVFVHDGVTLTAIAMGCGALGGGASTGACGDPSPIGGTFSGFFTGTIFAPAVNAAGDVLFMADVVGGSAPRGLFLFGAASGTIVKVAAPGDASPLGGTFAMVGPGTLNASGTVAFLASGSSAGPSDVFLWNGASTSKVAAAGDAAPLGSTYLFLGSESFGFADGSTIPVGPVPDIDDAGNVVFRAITVDGRRGIVRQPAGGGAASWLVRDQEPTPEGGTFADFQGACLNEAGEIAFFADVRLTASIFTAGWFVGTTGSWRTGLAFGQGVGGGNCIGLAFSRNPMSPLDDAGNLIVWSDVFVGPDSVEHVVVRARDGTLTIVARAGTPTPLGGTHGTFDAWPSLDAHGRGSYSGNAPGSGVLSAHFLFEACPRASGVLRNGSGVNRGCFGAAPPVLGTLWQAHVDASSQPGTILTGIFGHERAGAGIFLPQGELLVDPASPRRFLSVVAGTGVVSHSNPIPDKINLIGRFVALQGVILGRPAELCNAVDVVLGY